MENSYVSPILSPVWFQGVKEAVPVFPGEECLGFPPVSVGAAGATTCEDQDPSGQVLMYFEPSFFNLPTAWIRAPEGNRMTVGQKKAWQS